MRYRYHEFNTGNDLLDQSLENYIMHGFEPGGFLTSVLANDLFMAVGRADYWNKTNLHHIVHNVIHNMPSLSFGSYEAVTDWCRDADSRRSYYVEQLEKQRMLDIISGNYTTPVEENISF